MVGTHTLLDAKMEAVFSYTDQGQTVYNLQLDFVDLLKRKRRHTGTVVLLQDQKFQERISFTAISSVNTKMGIIAKMDAARFAILLSDGQEIVVGRHPESTLSPGDLTCIVERINILDPVHELEYVALPHTMNLSLEDLRLQSINADLLDASGNLLYRLSADPVLERRSRGASMAT